VIDRRVLHYGALVVAVLVLVAISVAVL